MGLCLVVLCAFVLCIAHSFRTPFSSLFFFLSNLPGRDRQTDRQTDRKKNGCIQRRQSTHKEKNGE